MKRQKLFLLKSLLAFGVMAVFLKTYQHSLIVKRSYQRQRLQQQKELLEKETSMLRARLFALKNPMRIKHELEEDLQMHALSLKQLVSVYALIDESVTVTYDGLRLLS